MEKPVRYSRLTVDGFQPCVVRFPSLVSLHKRALKPPSFLPRSTFSMPIIRIIYFALTKITFRMSITPWHPSVSQLLVFQPRIKFSSQDTFSLYKRPTLFSRSICSAPLTTSSFSYPSHSSPIFSSLSFFPLHKSPPPFRKVSAPLQWVIHLFRLH